MTYTWNLYFNPKNSENIFLKRGSHHPWGQRPVLCLPQLESGRTPKILQPSSECLLGSSQTQHVTSSLSAGAGGRWMSVPLFLALLSLGSVSHLSWCPFQHHMSHWALQPRQERSRRVPVFANSTHSFGLPAPHGSYPYIPHLLFPLKKDSFLIPFPAAAALFFHLPYSKTHTQSHPSKGSPQFLLFQFFFERIQSPASVAPQVMFSSVHKTTPCLLPTTSILGYHIWTYGITPFSSKHLSIFGWRQHVTSSSFPTLWGLLPALPSFTAPPL